KHMAIKHIPKTYAEFYELFDSYELEHFAFTEGGRAVSDATLELMVSFYPAGQRPLVRPFTKALLDDRLIQAFDYPEPSRIWRKLSSGVLKLRAKIVRGMPPREEPCWGRDNPNIVSYPDGYSPSRIGILPRGYQGPHGKLNDRLPQPRGLVEPPGHTLDPEVALSGGLQICLGPPRGSCNNPCDVLAGV